MKPATVLPYPATDMTKDFKKRRLSYVMHDKTQCNHMKDGGGLESEKQMKEAEVREKACKMLHCWL